MNSGTAAPKAAENNGARSSGRSASVATASRSEGKEAATAASHQASWPGLSRLSTRSGTWMPGTRPGMTDWRGIPEKLFLLGAVGHPPDLGGIGVERPGFVALHLPHDP